MKKLVKTILLIIVAGFFGYLFGVFSEDIDRLTYPEYALRRTGLSMEYAPDYSLYGFADGRDSFTQDKFIVDGQKERESLYAEMASAKNWRIAPATAEDYRRFQQTCLWECATVLDVPEDIVFDAWYYKERGEPAGWEPQVPAGAFSEIGKVGRGFVFAVYDLESGLFILVDQFG